MKQLLLSSVFLFFFSFAIAQTNFIKQDSVISQSSDCTGGVSTCIDSIKFDDIVDYRFFLNGNPFTSNFEACKEQDVYVYSFSTIFDGGETQLSLDSWFINGQRADGLPNNTATPLIANFTSINQLLDSMRKWNPAANWQLENLIAIGRPSSTIAYSDMGFSRLTRGGTTTANRATVTELTGLKFKVPAGLHKFVVEKISDGNRDTLTLGAACIQRDTIRQTQFVGTTRSHCMNVSQLLGTPVLATFSNFCSQTYTKVKFEPLYNFCVDMTGLATGTDTACLRVCDQYGICDTTYLYTTAEVNTSRFYIVEDTITIGLSRDKCNIKLPSGNPLTFRNDCPTRSGNSIDFTIDQGTRCISYTAKGVGADTACIIVCNPLGECDTTHFFITGQNPVVNPSGNRSKVLFDTITVGQIKTNCSITIPSGTLKSFNNFCPLASGNNVAFDVDSAGGCISYRGLVVGTNNACIRVCNTSDVCDTTNYFVTVQAVQTTGRTVTIRDTVLLGATRQKCDFTIPAGTIASFSNECANNTSNSVNFNTDFGTRCVVFTGLALGFDTACIKVCNTEGVCDSNIFIVETKSAVVNPPIGSRTIFRDTVTVGTSMQKCDFTKPTGLINTFENLCLVNSGTNVSFVLDATNNCVRYSGILASAEPDTACVRVCNASGICDTTLFIIEAKPAPANGGFRNYTVRDTVVVGATRQKCNFTVPTGTITSFDNICVNNSGTDVRFTTDATTLCVTFRGLIAGIDTACVKVCNASGICDTTYFIVESKPAIDPNVGSSTVFRDTITVGFQRQKCDVKLPVGTINVFQNLCTANSGTNITFGLDLITRCVTYTGLVAGIDSACLRVCNTNNICDTTYLYIEALPLPIPSTNHSARDTISVGANRTKCDFIKPNNATLIQNLCPTSSGTGIRFELDTLNKCVRYTGLAIDADTACIRICDATGKCDTTTFIVTGLNPNRPRIVPSVDTIRLSIFERKSYCPDSLQLTGSPISLLKFCTPANFDNSNITLDTIKKCVNVVGLKTGVDTFCLALCNTAGFCDTTTLYVIVSTDTIKPTAAIDSITIKIGELNVYCPDSLELASGALASIGSCKPLNLTSSTLNFNSIKKCAEVRGARAGRDTACIVLCNSLGLCDTTTLYIRVTSDTVKPVADTARLTIVLGQNVVFDKIDTTQLNGSVMTINDICPGKNGTKARMILDRQAKKVSITGVNVGRDTMCIAVCDTISKLCDTTTIIVTVQDTARLQGIKAFDDFDTLRLGKSLVFQVYNNDSLQRQIPRFLTIITPPLKGKADTISFRDGLIKYTAGKGPSACGLDSFRYRVCIDSTICSEATVVIDVRCAEGLKSYTGFSPNGDGRNDFFFIEGLQRYPDNTLVVYNRWGNEVFKGKNYQNDWDGRWNGKDLPDGTYFYWLRDDATGEVLSTGYVQILR